MVYTESKESLVVHNCLGDMLINLPVLLSIFINKSGFKSWAGDSTNQNIMSKKIKIKLL